MKCQITASYFSINLEDSIAISSCPGTIQGTTPTPRGKTIEHSVDISQSSLVKVIESKGKTKVKAITFVAWQ